MAFTQGIKADGKRCTVLNKCLLMPSQLPQTEANIEPTVRNACRAFAQDIKADGKRCTVLNKCLLMLSQVSQSQANVVPTGCNFFMALTQDFKAPRKVHALPIEGFMCARFLNLKDTRISVPHAHGRQHPMELTQKRRCIAQVSSWGTTRLCLRYKKVHVSKVLHCASLENCNNDARRHKQHLKITK